MENTVRTKDGRPIWVSTNGFPVLDDHGAFRGYRGSDTDITGRKRLEEELRESEEMFRCLIENAPEAIFVHADARFIYLNHLAVNLFGAKTADQLIGSPVIERIHPAYHEIVAERVRLLYEERRILPILEQVYLRLDGSSVRVEAHALPIAYGNRNAGLAFVRDITERKRAEEEKRSLEERLNRAEKMEALGVLAGGVAHDLNNVLGIIVGYAELLLFKADESSAIRPQLGEIMKGGQRAAAIVQDLLTLARRGIPGRDVVNLNRIISDFRTLPEFQQLSSYHSSVQIKTDLEDDLPNISGSAVHLGKTLFNLASNASEAMPQGGVLTIRTANQYLDKPLHGYDEVREGDYVVLSVSDTGEGMPAADLNRIFEPFYTKKVMGKSGTGWMMLRNSGSWLPKCSRN
ncbi:MAG: PAS domain S-box protein [Candidatus Edwardsbacteria bacterium]|nr:PAS domain S-box protein [Candidatus Edwardsbacteria bacterium]